MANNLTAKDASNANVTLKTTDNSGVHNPHHNVDVVAAGASPDIGAVADTAWAGSGSSSVIAALKGIFGLLSGAITVKKSQQLIVDCVITNGTTDSSIIDLGVYRLTGIVIPSTFEGTVITPKSSWDGSTVVSIYDTTGAQKTFTVAANRRVVVTPADFLGVRYLVLSSNTSVGANRTIKLILEA